MLNAAEDEDVIFLESRSGTSGAQKRKAGPPEPVLMSKQPYYGVGPDGLKGNVSEVSLQSFDSKDGTYMKKDVMFGTGKPATSDKSAESLKDIKDVVSMKEELEAKESDNQPDEVSTNFEPLSKSENEARKYDFYDMLALGI